MSAELPNLNQLQIPTQFRDTDLLSQEDAAGLEQWKADAHNSLLRLEGYLLERNVEDIEQLAAIVHAVAPFAGQGPWVSENDRLLAHEILERIPPSVQLIERILSSRVKPVFQPTPHPMLNPSTGRKLSRPLGGPSAQIDHFEGQVWKSQLGIENVVLWCLSHMEISAYERLWHLLIPPIMILLDDYEVQYRIKGVRVVRQLAQNVPRELLKRTGMDGLLLSSMKTGIGYLHNPLTSTLIREIVPTWVALAELTTPEGSAARFDQLCALLGDAIIGSIWSYGMRDPETIEASIDVLPVVVKALGIGTARYLKAVIPQLMFPLSAKPENSASLSLQMASLRALRVTIQECAPRMFNWKGLIMSGVAQRWVILKDSGADNEDARSLQEELKTVTQCLLHACPSLVEDEFRVLLETDRQMFEPLIRVGDKGSLRAWSSAVIPETETFPAVGQSSEIGR